MERVYIDLSTFAQGYKLWTSNISMWWRPNLFQNTNVSGLFYNSTSPNECTYPIHTDVFNFACETIYFISWPTQWKDGSIYMREKQWPFMLNFLNGIRVELSNKKETTSFFRVKMLSTSYLNKLLWHRGKKLTIYLIKCNQDCSC